MQQQHNPQEIYQQQLDKWTHILKGLKLKRTRFGWLRLIIVIGIIIGIYSLFFNPPVLNWLAVAVAIGLFLYMVSVDTDNNERIAATERLLAINQEELQILKGHFYNREDGSIFLPADHAYAGDVDLFGKASIYQYLNRCTSQQSKQLFAQLLLSSSSPDTITDRQETAKVLSGELEWRHSFQSTGVAKPLTKTTEEKITNWLKITAPFTAKQWQVIPNIFTLVTLSFLVAYLFDLIPLGIFSAAVLIFFLIAKSTSAKVHKTYMALSKIEEEVDTIEQQIKLVEHVPASAKLLDQYKQNLLADKGGSGSIRELKEIIHRFNFRLNVFVFLFLNTFLLWDVRQMVHLNNWKAKNAAAVPRWFNILSNIEILNTLAILSFNHPTWIFPSMQENYFTLHANDVGHPLIPVAGRVDNSFSTEGVGKVSIITGSNMAGKSTFLRSLAVNLVLAQMGAPVCASAFIFSPVRLYSSMRIADNLAENTSTFYAELKKLKTIIDQVKQHEKVFILLDEILRGTNSLDRHTGSEALIKQLIKEKAVAVIATHDVELAALKDLYHKAIENYHFDVQVEGEELYFDYKLKRGICQSLNASLLMKKIGIEI
jgi:hypothetical protein